MSVSINIIAEINESVSMSKLTINREKIKHLTIQSLANNVNQDWYQPDKFKCWCRTKNSAYIQVIDDNLLSCLLASYWADSNEFDVIFRSAQKTSPNTSPPESPPSANNALSELTSKLSLREVENKVDPFSQEEVAKIDSKDRLIISNDAHSIMVDSNYIIDFIESQLNEGLNLFQNSIILKRLAIKIIIIDKGNSIFDIELKTVVETSTLSILFTSDVWSRCLLRKHKCNNIELNLCFF